MGAHRSNELVGTRCSVDTLLISGRTPPFFNFSSSTNGAHTPGQYLWDRASFSQAPEDQSSPDIGL
jgi:hypothetical protein